ncbi:MAG: dihydroneopterin aldolase [Pelagibacteraceae bacterium TMED232]|nr:MAG: dihydroneopterin aldolase [Pelagibacteraceae bacterium TMED232]|tara:strand:+ start:1336 stop:1740 length:405 start_codon:yes stop_codon:yes gene_type:complete
MKIIKFKEKRNYNYKRKILVKDLIIKILVGIHNFEKKKKQRVRFNIEINIDPNLAPDESNLNSIVNYEDIIKSIKKITNKRHYPLLETLGEDIFFRLFKDTKIKKIKLRIEKLDIIKNTSSVGIEIEKIRSNER